MSHIFFFTLIIGFALGMGVLFLFFSLNKKYCQPVLRYFLAVLICLGFAIFSDLFTFYISLVLTDSPNTLQNLIVVSSIIYHLSMGGLVYVLPHLVGELLGQPVSQRLRNILLGLMLFYPAGVIAYFITRQEFFATIGDGLLMVIIVHSLYRLFPRGREGENPHLRKIANAMLILLGIFLPLFSLEIIFEPLLTEIDRIFFDASVFLLVFYLAWNITNAAFIYKQFNQAFESGGYALFTERMAAFQLSNREQEIAALVAAGAANKEIAAQLNISAMTVKNHIYNIYKKTDANGRVDLLNILSGRK